MSRILSDLRAGWGWRDAQAHLASQMADREL
jgi:hypothetical protein